MQTRIAPEFKHQNDIAEADKILRSCVHCGFCNATCPTYQLLGSELDGPRGRIYLIKDLLEGKQATAKTQLHLDRCLTCRACETTCPSGVRYGRLIEIGRNIVEKKVARTFTDRILRKVILKILPNQQLFNMLLILGRMLKPLLPSVLKTKLPTPKIAQPWPISNHRRQMLVLEGCVQPLTTPNTNAAAARVLDKLGISLISAAKAGCCGAINQHLSDTDTAKQRMRNNIDAWWPYVDGGIEAIVMTASGCGLMVKEYGQELKNDPDYADKAAHISHLSKDLSEILRDEGLNRFANIGKGTKVAYQSSCTLQHGQKLSGAVEAILQQCGYRLTPVADNHLCCGAAGTYTLLQPKLSQQLLHNKLTALQQGQPDVIASANVGCQMQLESGSQIPVKHWIELLA